MRSFVDECLTVDRGPVFAHEASLYKLEPINESCVRVTPPGTPVSAELNTLGAFSTLGS